LQSGKPKKWPKNGGCLQNGQMRFSMVSALQKWPNFLKLAMKWPNLATPDKIPKTESTVAEADWETC